MQADNLPFLKKIVTFVFCSLMINFLIASIFGLIVGFGGAFALTPEGNIEITVEVVELLQDFLSPVLSL